VAMTASELLTLVDEKIKQILNGAEQVSVNGQTFHYTQLKELRAWRRELKVEAAEEEGTDDRGSFEVTFSD